MIPILIAIVSTALAASPATGENSSSRNVSVLLESASFTVKAFDGLDVSALLDRLNYDYFLQVDTFLMNGEGDVNPEGFLIRTLEAVYREVETILGLQTPDSRIVIHLCPDQKAVREEFHKLYRMDFDERSFYVYDLDTIFISYEDLTLGMLGHEIAHAVISKYFVVPPPTKVQEVLAGYVEYSLRKTEFK